MKELSKRLSYLLIMIVSIANCATMTSCGDDDEPRDKSIVGAWYYTSNYTFNFKSNGEGYSTLKNPGMPTSISNFTWTASKSVLTLSYDGSGGVNPHTESYLYRISGNNLILIDIEYGDSKTFTRI